MRLNDYVDGAIKGSLTAPPYRWGWDTTTASNGPHSLVSKAYDPSNNEGTSAAVTVNVNNPTGSPELLKNGGFEGTSAPWGFSGYASWASGYAHTGAAYALLGGRTKVSGSVSQAVRIPSTANATLTFWLSVSSNDTSGQKNDVLYVEVLDGAVPTTVATFSNQDRGAAGPYLRKSFSLAAWKNKTVTLQFRATNNKTRATSFLVDDVSPR